MRKDSPERYDRAYFERWYRDPRTRVKSSASIRRKAFLALSVAEYYLERPVRTVLDVGCGEGNWLAPLKALRPGISYTGVDSSSYAIGRYGRSRNIKQGSFATLGELRLASRYDLIVCSDTLFYLTIEELKTGLRFLAPRTEGLAFLELYTDGDSLTGDFPDKGLRSASYYRSLLRGYGFLSVGSHCYLGPEMTGMAMEMEKA